LMHNGEVDIREGDRGWGGTLCVCVPVYVCMGVFMNTSILRGQN